MAIGLSAVWRSLGVEPAAVVGHSQGEVPAAVISGALTLEQGAQIVAQRSQAVLTVAGQGGMALIERPLAEVEEFLAPYGDALSVAAVNTPGSTVISGQAQAIEQIVGELQAQDVYARTIKVDYASHNAQMDPLLPGLADSFADLTPGRAQIGFYSTVTGQAVEGPELDGGYWCRNLREPVRFDRALEQLLADGHSVFVEISAHPVLAMPLTDASAEHGGVVVGSLARDRGDQAQLLRNLGVLHVHGVELDWDRILGGSGGLVALPTYAFQRERFWVQTSKTVARNEHPWLGPALSLADGDGYVLTGRLSVAEHPWLADHAVFGTILVPGTALLEIALTAAHQAGADRVSELTLLEPLVLPEDTAVQVQAVIHAEEITIYSRIDDAPWRRHATGVLTGPGPVFEPDDWPVAEAEPIDLDGFYDRFAERGLDYGPAFQGLTELCRAGDTAYGLVRLPDGLNPNGFGIHPALLDAALHTLTGIRDDGAVLLPFAWTGVELYATGATELRVRIDLDGDAVRIAVTDGAGQPVLRADRLVIRAATAEQVRAGDTAGHLYRVDFRPVAGVAPNPATGAVWVLGVDGMAKLDSLLARDGASPDRVIVDATAPDADPLTVTTAALLMAQRLLAEPELARAELVWVTSGAVDAGDGVAELAGAPLWGLLRAVRAEYPDRVIHLVDTDDPSDPAGIAVPAGEPEIAIRGGEIRAARLVPVAASADGPVAFDPEGAVLITGGTGELGRLVARHLVARHGVRHLVLTSRRGPDAPGAADLAAGLTEAGARTVRVVGCDAGRRAELAAVLDAAERPWTGVFHLAAVLDDGVLAGQSPERLEAVWRPKAGGAAHLHELTRDLDLAAFVLFSSAAGVLGGAGQANYAAANAFLDALAAHRRTLGRPAVSVSWGLWQQSGIGLTARLGQAELARMRRRGVAALSAEQGLAALDAALGPDHAHLVPVRLDRDPDQVPALLRGLIRAPRKRLGPAGAPAGLRERLLGLPAAERTTRLTELVRREAAVVLGMSGPDHLAAGQVLKDLGLDSLMAVELRRRLAAETGLTLPATLAFDYPTPTAIAGLLLDKLALGGPAASRPAPARAGAVPNEPIAIIAMACRLPGGIDSPESYWDLLADGADAIGEFPPRWEKLDVYDPDPEAPGKTYAREGGFIHDVEGFDAAFFGISQRETVSMDPQQRVVLETAWEALERAGIRPAGLSESRTGVYLGAMSSDYGEQGRQLDAFDGYLSTGNATSVVSGRVAYTLGLQGPAVSVDTACSSSLVALHLAVNALRQNECDLALAGGVTVMSTPRLFVEFSRLKGMAPDGRCKSFSALADGAGWSDGCGILVLKRLSAAERDGDQVLAVIRGSAVNQDGRSQGLTAPNGPSQQRVIRDALAAARLTPADIDAVEAHGTGTTLGDPIEAGALAEVFGPHRDTNQPLYLGSAKSNLGHTQAAAGVVGVIKMVLALQHQTLPKTLHAEQPSPHIPWDDSGLHLLTQPQPWPHNDTRPRRAGVSSFGLSGTNGHLVLEEAPATEPAGAAVEGTFPLVLSGRTEAAVRAQAGRWADWIAGHPQVPLGDIVATAAHRTHFEHRASIGVTTRAETLQALRDLAEGRTPAGASLGEAAEGGTAMLFTGQGCQRLCMGRGLYAAFPVFRAAFDEVCAALDPHLSRALGDVLLAGEDGPDAVLVNETEFTQP
ncbi:MAG TPA: beta-ketoacyl synthase N-terminal-like domain-containing protein, partial [Actinophytocola sp.]|uniref:polyketide synthase n=1 Tax=Actinophytocola sp. TaxID=1872138 RepID=UPI002DBD86B2